MDYKRIFFYWFTLKIDINVLHMAYIINDIWVLNDSIVLDCFIICMNIIFVIVVIIIPPRGFNPLNGCKSSLFWENMD